jgi:hypothetical protein
MQSMQDARQRDARLARHLRQLDTARSRRRQVGAGSIVDEIPEIGAVEGRSERPGVLPTAPLEARAGVRAGGSRAPLQAHRHPPERPGLDGDPAGPHQIAEAGPQVIRRELELLAEPRERAHEHDVVVGEGFEDVALAEQPSIHRGIA